MSRDDIESLVHRYSDAVVHRDEPQWRSTWAPDAVWDLGGGRRIEGVDAIVDLWRDAMERHELVVQTVANGTVELDGDNDGDGGVGRWYVHEIMQLPGEEPGLMIAHYDDRYVRLDGGWRFASRELVVHYRDR